LRGGARQLHYARRLIFHSVRRRSSELRAPPLLAAQTLVALDLGVGLLGICERVDCEGALGAGGVQIGGTRSCSYMLNKRNEETNTVFFSYLACFVNTFTLNTDVSMSYTGLTRRNT